MSWITLMLAQDAAPTTTAARPDATSALLLPALMIGVVTFLILTSRSQKKREERARTDMYGRMGKNDRVLTVGGIIGTVVSVKDNEVVLKVDESTNTKMTFLKSAIQRVLSEEPGGGEGKNR